MLLHASRFVQPSENIGSQIIKYIKSLKASFIGNKKSLIELKYTWINDFENNIDPDNNIPDSPINYEDIEKSILELLDLDKFDVGIVNGKAEDKEEYDKKLKRKLNIIAIGGQRLSRGLTLKKALLLVIL